MKFESNMCAAANSERIKFPFEITAVEPEVNAELLEYFKGERTGFVQVGPEKYFFPHKYKSEAEAYYNFKARPDDIWIVTFPRSGTTWTQELVWLLANSFDYDGAKKRLLTERFPFFEFPVFLHPDLKSDLLAESAGDTEKQTFIEKISIPGYEALSKVDHKCRRFIKTHFPFSLLPPSVLEQKCKIIYVARNPKDVAVSYYHLNRLFRTQGYCSDFARYWRYFEKGLNPWMPYHSHIKEALALRHLPNVLFLRYEDMLKDLSGAIVEVAHFLNTKLRAEDLQNLVNHLSIANFRLNSSVNGHEMKSVGILNTGEASFVRTGGTGGVDGTKHEPNVQREFGDNPELLARADNWILDNRSQILE